MYPLERYEDIQMRLNRCACMYKGKAYVIRTATNLPVNSVYLVDMRHMGGPQQDHIPVSVTDVDFFVSNYNLGYLNVRSLKKVDYDPNTAQEAIYVTRLPVRIQHQGLSTASLSWRNMTGNHYVTFNSAFADMLEGNYPTAKHALRVVFEQRDRRGSCAFSNDWAIVAIDAYTIQLHYQENLVGTYDYRKKAFIINTDIPGVLYLVDDLKTLDLPFELDTKGEVFT